MRVRVCHNERILMTVPDYFQSRWKMPASIRINPGIILKRAVACLAPECQPEQAQDLGNTLRVHLDLVNQTINLETLVKEKAFSEMDFLRLRKGDREFFTETPWLPAIVGRLGLAEDVDPVYCVKNLTSDSLARLDKKKIFLLPPEAIEVFQPWQLAALSPEQIKIFLPEQIKLFSVEQIRALTDQQIGALTENQIRVLSRKQIQALMNTQLLGLTNAQLGMFYPWQVKVLLPWQIQIIVFPLVMKGVSEVPLITGLFAAASDASRCTIYDLARDHQLLRALEEALESLPD